MAMMLANGYDVGEIGFFIFYFIFLAGFGVEVQESLSGYLARYERVTTQRHNRKGLVRDKQNMD